MGILGRRFRTPNVKKSRGYLLVFSGWLKQLEPIGALSWGVFRLVQTESREWRGEG